MKTTLVVIMGSVCLIGISLALNIIEEQCSCSCCIGFNCIPIAKPDFNIPLCSEDESLCVIYCKRYYPIDCDDVGSETFAVCNSAGSNIFNPYFVLFLLVLFISVTRMDII